MYAGEVVYTIQLNEIERERERERERLFKQHREYT